MSNVLDVPSVASRHDELDIQAPPRLRAKLDMICHPLGVRGKSQQQIAFCQLWILHKLSKCRRLFQALHKHLRLHFLSNSYGAVNRAARFTALKTHIFSPLCLPLMAASLSKGYTTLVPIQKSWVRPLPCPMLPSTLTQAPHGSAQKRTGVTHTCV